jgi:hypothetical protein
MNEYITWLAYAAGTYAFIHPLCRLNDLIQVKWKVNLSLWSPLMHIRSAGLAPFIHNLIMRWNWWSALHVSRFTPGKAPGTHWIGGWVCTTIDVDVQGKNVFRFLPITIIEPWSLRHLVSSIFNILTFTSCFSFMCVVGSFVASWGYRSKPRNCFNQGGKLSFPTQKAII